MFLNRRLNRSCGYVGSSANLWWALGLPNTDILRNHPLINKKVCIDLSAAR